MNQVQKNPPALQADQETKRLPSTQEPAGDSGTKKSRLFVPPRDPVLRFSPTAWAKLLFFRDIGNTEIGGFGIGAEDDLLHVEDFLTVRQENTVASISFDDESVADFFDRQVDAGRRPEQFARIWLHTHPGDSPKPSPTDEETFHRVFGRCQWAVLFVLANTGKTYARLRFNLGPGGSMQLPVEIDFAREFGATSHEAWFAEYEASIRTHAWPAMAGTTMAEAAMAGAAVPFGGSCSSEEVLAHLEALPVDERQEFIDELASRPDLWGEEVML